MKMNHTIKDLAEQATHRFYPVGSNGHPEIRSHFDVEKFAESLIFECITIAVFRGDSATAKAIKEHFGVE